MSNILNNTFYFCRNGLCDLLATLSQLPNFHGESTSFGEHMIAAAASQCFEVGAEDKDKVGSAGASSAIGSSAGGRLLTEADLMRWLLREPQMIVWLPTFYRLLSAKAVRHGIRCANCKIKDINGMRYLDETLLVSHRLSSLFCVSWCCILIVCSIQRTCLTVKWLCICKLPLPLPYLLIICIGT